jgi:type I restriction enzyme M protein
VKRPSRLNFSFAPIRIERLKATPEFQEIAASDKEPGKERDKEIRIGNQIQDDILLLLSDMDGQRIYHDRDEFRKLLESVFKGFIRIPPYFWDVLMDALSDREE